MLKRLKFYFLVLALGSPLLSAAQLQIDSLYVLNDHLLANLNSEGDTVDWFTYKNGVNGAQSPYFTHKIDSLGNVLSSSNFSYPANRQSDLKRLKIGATYHTMRINRGADTLAFYQSNNDSTLGTLVAFAQIPSWSYISAFRRTSQDEVLGVVMVGDLLPGVGTVQRPMIVRYVPSTATLSLLPLYERNGIPIYGWELELYGVNSISNNRRIVSCTNCKRYTIGGNLETTQHGDIAVYDQNFQFITDTVPLFSPSPNFPLGTQAIQGPVQLSAVEELSSGNLIFLGTVRDVTPSGQFDLTLAKWSSQLQKIQQVRFGNPNRLEYFREGNSLVQGFDGFIYTITNVSDQPSNMEGGGVYICKFDTNLNLIEQTTIELNSRILVEDVTVNRTGVYFTASNSLSFSDNKSYLFRIRNSGVGVGVKRGEQLVAARVYPNPVQELLYWEAEQETQRFVWYDMQGRQLREEQFTAAQRQELNTETLAPGIYLLQAFTPDGRNFAPQRVVVR